MSRASEWHDRMQTYRDERPTLRLDGYDWPVANVADNGWLKVHVPDLEPAEALALAAWITATFGDGPSA